MIRDRHVDGKRIEGNRISTSIGNLVQDVVKTGGVRPYCDGCEAAHLSSTAPSGAHMDILGVEFYSQTTGKRKKELLQTHVLNKITINMFKFTILFKFILKPSRPN